MSDTMFQKVLGLLGKAWVADPFQAPILDTPAFPPVQAQTLDQPVKISPQAIGSAEIYGDVPFVPPEFNR